MRVFAASTSLSLCLECIQLVSHWYVMPRRIMLCCAPTLHSQCKAKKASLQKHVVSQMYQCSRACLPLPPSSLRLSSINPHRIQILGEPPLQLGSHNLQARFFKQSPKLVIRPRDTRIGLIIDILPKLMVGQVLL
jgi:hypothetical protein